MSRFFYFTRTTIRVIDTLFFCWYDSRMLPTLGNLGPITLHTYTVALDLAVLAGLVSLAWQGSRLMNAPARWTDAGLAALGAGLVAARLGHVAIHWNYFSLNPGEIFLFWRGGLDWHAALGGGLFGLWGATRILKLPYHFLLDALAVPLVFGAALVWLGCLAAGCGYGAEVRSLADYPSDIVAELPDLYGLLAPRFNTQLFGAILSVGLMLPALLLRLIIKRAGVRFWLILLLLALGTLVIGNWRGDAVPQVGDLRLDQLLDATIAALAFAGLVVSGWPRKQTPSQTPSEPVSEESVAHAA